MEVRWLILVIYFYVNDCISAERQSHIMIYAAMSSKSETLFYFPFANELATKGHRVTVVTEFEPFEEMHRNVKFIVIKELKDISLSNYGFDAIRSRIDNGGPSPESHVISTAGDIIKSVCELVMVKTNYLYSAIKDDKIDLIIFNGCNECGLALVDMFNCPFISMDSSGFFPWHSDSSGNPHMAAISPSVISTFTNEMSLFQRVINAMYIIYWNLSRQNIVLDLDKMLKGTKYLSESSKSLSDIYKNGSLVLVVRDESLDYPRPFLPNVKRIGGCFRCRVAKPITKNILDFIDGAGDNGFIYFSLGSIAKLHSNKEFFRNKFFRAFEQLPQRILVKWDEDVKNEEIGAPSNVMLSKWYPQQDILGHPKCKVFITHSGLFSTTESVYHGVPMLSVPLFWDQDYNAGFIEKIGMGVKIEVATVTSDIILSSLKKLTTDSSYRTVAHRHSRILRDQQVPPLETAVYWTEYVLRHNGADHFRSIPSFQLAWYQQWFLDAAAFLILGLFIIVKLLKFILCHIYSVFRPTQDQKYKGKTD